MSRILGNLFANLIVVLLMLLSAIESWSFSDNHKMPDYLHDNLCAAVDVLRHEMMGGK